MSSYMAQWMEKHLQFYCKSASDALQAGAYEDDYAHYLTLSFEEFVVGNAHIYPQKGLWAAMMAAKNFLPSNGVDQQLITARGVILSNAVSDGELQTQVEILNSCDTTLPAENYYKLAMIFIANLRLGTEKNISIVSAGNRIQSYLFHSGVKDAAKVMADYAREIHPFDTWIEEVKEALKDSPFAGQPDYFPI